MLGDEKEDKGKSETNAIVVSRSFSFSSVSPGISVSVCSVRALSLRLCHDLFACSVSLAGELVVRSVRFSLFGAK